MKASREWGGRAFWLNMSETPLLRLTRNSSGRKCNGSSENLIEDSDRVRVLKRIPSFKRGTHAWEFFYR